jgi:hypothetical protein
MLYHAIEIVIKDYYNNVMQKIDRYYDVRNTIIYTSVGRHLIVAKICTTAFETTNFIFSVRDDDVSFPVAISTSPQMTEHDWLKFFDELVYDNFHTSVY